MEQEPPECKKEIKYRLKKKMLGVNLNEKTGEVSVVEDVFNVCDSIEVVVEGKIQKDADPTHRQSSVKFD